MAMAVLAIFRFGIGMLPVLAACPGRRALLFCHRHGAAESRAHNHEEEEERLEGRRSGTLSLSAHRYENQGVE
jgi:hypothetical protein